jgi:hypothetical protein
MRTQTARTQRKKPSESVFDADVSAVASLAIDCSRNTHLAQALGLRLCWNSWQFLIHHIHAFHV